MTISTDRIAVCSWSLRPSGPDELIERLQRLKIARVQLALSPLVNDPAVWGGAVGKLRSAGITIVSGMMALAGEDYSTLESIARTGGVRPDATWPANEQHAVAVAELASKDSISLVTFHAGFIPEDEADPERATLIERLQRMADIFAERRVNLAFETGQETACTLLNALTAINRPNLGINFDPANMILYDQGDPVLALERLATHVVQVHVKDAIESELPGEWGEEVQAGHGAVNWGDFFTIARGIDPPVDFVIEREAGEDREGDIACAAKLIADHL